MEKSLLLSHSTGGCRDVPGVFSPLLEKQVAPFPLDTFSLKQNYDNFGRVVLA